MRVLLVPVSLIGLSLSLVPAMLNAQEIGSGRMTMKNDQILSSTQDRAPSSPRGQSRVTVILRDSTMKFAIQEVLRQAKVRLIFNAHSPVLAKRIQVHVVDVPVSSALETILRGSGLVAKFGSDGETVMIRTNADAGDISESARVGIISGRVTDSATSRGLGGVTVTVKGANISKITNGNGEFTLAGVPAGEQTVEFKLVGYRPFSKTMRVNDGETMTVNAVLRPAATMLSEVVTTAVGQQQRREVGYTVASVNVDSLIRIAPIKSMTDIFENRIPGVTVQRTSGSPGDPARIRFRGAGSISENNDPIIIVDGVRRDGGQSDTRNIINSSTGRYATTSPLDQIDYNNVERIDILKGPSAAALYGSDASSGVIVITTKRGKSGPPQWNVNLQTGITEFPGAWPTSTYTWVTPISGGVSVLCLGFCGDAGIDSVRRFQALNEPYLTPLSRGHTFIPSATVSGGSGSVNYNFSATSLRERGILKLPDIEVARFQRYQERSAPGWMRRPESLERNSVGGNVDLGLNAAQTTTLRFITNLTQEVQRKTSMTSSSNPAIEQLRGIFIDQFQLGETPLIENPYERITSPTVTLANTVQLAATPFSWLNVRATAGINSRTSNRTQVIESGLLPPGPTMSSPEDLSGGAFLGQSASSQNTTTTLALSTPTIRRIQVNAGFNYDRERIDDQNGRFFGLPPGVEEPAAGMNTTRTTFRRSTQERIMFGYYFQPRLILSERFNLTPGFRLDQNGLAGENAQFNTLPKMDFSWVVSEEPYFPFQSVVSELRLRTAFGIAGKQPTTGDLNRLYQFSTINPLAGGTESLYGTILQLSNLGNTRLRPERVTEFDGGFDLGLWNNRAFLSFGYARKFTKDMVIPSAVATSAAGNIPNLRTNLGDVKNQTLEMSLNATPLELEKVGFNFTLNFDRQRSLIQRLNPGALAASSASGASPSSGVVQYIVGYPMEGIWMRPIRGYSDLDGNGWIAKSELIVGKTPVLVGTTYPSYNLSFLPTVTLLKRFTISSSISHVSGQTQSLSVTNNLEAGVPGPSYISDIVFGVDGFDRQAAYIAANLFSFNAEGSYIGYTQKVDVTRLEYLSITTNLSPRIARLVRARAIDVGVRGNNLALWTNYIGVDPNVNGNLGNAGLYDNGQIPKTREWSLNFNLRF